MSTIRKSKRRGTVGLAALLALIGLALVAVGLWSAASVVNQPLTDPTFRGTEGYEHLFSVYGSGPDRLHRPTEVAVDTRGQVYVTDQSKHRIVVFTSDGEYVRTIGSPAEADGALNYPAAITVDGRGRVYTTSSEPDRVVIYNPDGTVFNHFPVERPTALALTGQRLYIATARGILIGDLDGNQVGQLSSSGSEPGQINRATGMAVDDDGTIYLADSLNYRFQALNQDGSPLWTLGQGPDPAQAVVDQTRTYGLPTSVMIGSDDLLYGVDTFNGEVVVLNKEGEQVATFGAWGRSDGEFYYPTGIAQVSPAQLVIADTFNDRLQFIRIPTVAPSFLQRGQQAFPWLIPLALAGFLVALIRRPTKFVSDAPALERISAEGALDELVEMGRPICVPAGTRGLVQALLEQNPKLGELLEEIPVEDSSDDPRGLGDPMLDMAVDLRGRHGLRRVVIIHPDPAQSELAEAHGIGILGPRADALSPATS